MSKDRITTLNEILNLKVKEREGKKMNKQTEYQLSLKIASYLKYQHSKLIFKFANDDGNLTMMQAVRRKKVNPFSGFPDFQLFKKSGNYAGLLIELKRDKSQVYKKNGEYKKNEHLKKQVEMHERLRKEGYKVHFCWDLEGFISILNEYLEAK